jgi:hypothetical protein
MKNVKSKTRTRLTDEHLEGCVRMATTEIKTDIQAEAVSNISLMNNFVKENDRIIYQPVCNSKLNLVAFLINCHCVTIK